MEDITLLCIGTNNDLVQFDHFGPRVGSLLQNYDIQGIKCYGNMEQPIHALNINDFYNAKKEEMEKTIIVVIDAAASSKKMLEMLMIKSRSTCINEGVRKNLLTIGDVINISAI